MTRCFHKAIKSEGLAIASLMLLTAALALSACGSTLDSSGSNLTTQTTVSVETTAVTAGEAATAQGTGVQIVAKNGAITPAELQIPVGTAVTFVNGEDDSTRTYEFVSDQGNLDTGVLQPGDTYEITFPVGCTVTFHDKTDSSIKGTIAVQ